MKKLVSACTAVALAAMLGVVPAVSAADAAPKLIAHDEFKEGAVGKDSVGSGDMKVLKQDGKSEATAKVVEGPNGMSALEFNRDYALATDKKDVLDGKKEYTVTFLVAANSEGKLVNNMFTTGLSDRNNIGQRGINVLMHENGYPEVRLYGSANDSTHQSDPNKWSINQFKNDDREIGKSNWKNATKPTTTDWYRVVVTVKLSDGKTKGDEITNANNEKYTAGSGVQTCYIEKIGGVSAKSDLVANKNYYSTVLPYDLNNIDNPNHGIALGGCYSWGDNDDTNSFYNKKEGEYRYDMFKGKMADVRIYDKALNQDQIVELFTKGDVTVAGTPDSKPSGNNGGGSPSTGVGMNMIPVLVALPAAAIACGLVLRKKKASK